MKLRINAACDVGLVRDGNEDMVLIGQRLLRDGHATEEVELGSASPAYCMAVADGLGGASAGEVASQLVLEQLRAGLAKVPPALEGAALNEHVEWLCADIHARIGLRGKQEPALRGMGATLAAIFYHAGHLQFMSAGDSRVYRYRDGILMQLTHDHSLASVVGARDPNGTIILNSFGGGASFHVDIGPVAGQLQEKDVFLICTDGLSDMVTDDELESLLGRAAPVDELLEAAKRAGGMDNISHIIVEVLEG